MTHLTRLGEANVFASLPFDQIDGVAGFYVHEDFEAANLMADFATTTGLIVNELGPHAWFGAEITGDPVSNITVPAAVADHLGIIQLQVGSTSPADGDACALQFGGDINTSQQMYLPDNNGLYIATVVRIPDVDQTIFEFSLSGQTPVVPSNVSPLDIAALLFDPEDSLNVGDAMFFAEMSDAGTDTSIVMDQVLYTENDWVLLEIALTDTYCSYRVTTEDATQTVTQAGTITVALRPAYVLENVGTIEAVLDIDLFHLRYLRRDSLVGGGADWLGA